MPVVIYKKNFPFIPQKNEIFKSGVARSKNIENYKPTRYVECSSLRRVSCALNEI